MSPAPEKPRPRTAADERAERLAEQLRANLRRRKDQARARRATPNDGTDGPTEAPEDADTAASRSPAGVDAP